MIIKKIIVKNYKILRDAAIYFNDDLNILVGDNDSGKSTILEAINIALTGKLNHVSLERQLNAILFNSETRKNYIDSADKTRLPVILIELYCEGDSKYKGTNNTLSENCPGIQVKIDFDEAYENIFKEEISKNEISDIPIEFYKVKFMYFNGSPVVFRDFPINSSFIDTSKNDIQAIQTKFISNKIDEFIPDSEQAVLDSIYRKYLNQFKADEAVNHFKEAVSNKVLINGKTIGFGIKDEIVNSWKEQVSILLDNCPFTSIGYGSQNIIKLGIALGNVKDNSNCLLVEEPENNLSYTNMSKLIDMLTSTKSQTFISTHSSFVANKMSLKKLIFVNNGLCKSFNGIKPETFEYFQKLPGYNTLRVVLSKKALLVEGPSEELLISKYFLDEYKKTPLAIGVDVICVNGLAFKRFLDIAILLEKEVAVITDNDHSVTESIDNKYKDYQKENISFFYETDEKLHTLEKSVFAVNSATNELKTKFKEIINCSEKTDEQTVDYMIKNKTEWSLKVFLSDKSIVYPEYIKNAIKKISGI